MPEIGSAILPDVTLLDAADASQGYSRQVIGGVLRSWTARLGLLWVALLALAAVFAPVLANSQPIALKQDGRWSSPMLAALTPADVILQAAFWSAVVLAALRRWSLARRTLIWLTLMIVTSAAAILFVHPPQLVMYDKYRESQREGKVDRIIYAPIRFSPDDHLLDAPELHLTSPTWDHPLGITDGNADLASNMLWATRIALSIGFISTGISVVIGVIIGALMGYYAGWFDLIGMRLVEIFDSIPQLLLLLCFVAVFQPNLYIMMAIIGATSWVGYAYFVRAEFLSLRDRDFVHAARALGLPVRSILFRHLLPNALTPIIVTASFGVASAILTESTLSFLGIGLVGETSWGGLLEEALGVGGTFYWWIALYPGLAIFLTVLAYNLIGEALRDALDPRLSRMM
jgi:peptide/nickel transport system permease protein